MVKTIGAAAASENWKKAIPRVAEAYGAGINRTTGWKEAAVAGEGNYAAGVQKAVANRSREAGLNAVTDGDWKEGAINKGKSRIGQGMSASAPWQATQAAKVISVIESAQIGERTLDVDANIDNRVKPLARALRAAKDAGNFR